MDLDQTLHARAEQQHGLITRAQMRALGASRSAIQHRTSGAGYGVLSPRVLRVAGSPATDAQRVMAAVLDAGQGAVLSHTSAAAWWGLPGFDLRTLQVTRHRNSTRRPCALAEVHEVKALHPSHVTVLQGVPISRPARVVFELAGSVHPGRAERACNNAWSRRLLCGASLVSMLDDWAEHGRAGTVVMREILESRPPGWVPPASGLESRFESILRHNCLPLMRRQVDSGGNSWVGRVDFRDGDLPLIAEILSERYHSALLDREADALRFRQLEASGFMVVTIWDNEVWNHPTLVADRLRLARQTLLSACDLHARACHSHAETGGGGSGGRGGWRRVSA